MQIRNDKNRIDKEVALSDVVWISCIKYYVYEITDKSIKIKSKDEKLPNGYKRKDFINKNTFAKRYFFDKQQQNWSCLKISRMPNLDYM
jgi:hypothetical protein